MEKNKFSYEQYFKIEFTEYDLVYLKSVLEKEKSNTAKNIITKIERALK